MATLIEIRDALIEEPKAFGLRLVWPMPRMDAPQVPVLVESAEIRGDGVELTYSRDGLRPGDELAPSDILWHQGSNTIALVITRMDRDRVMCLGLMAPETEEEVRAFVGTEGTGHWVCVFQGWRIDWSLPAELARKFPETVSVDEKGVMDLFPRTTAAGRQGGFVGQGMIDLAKLARHQRTSRFLERQRAAMMRLAAAIPDEEPAELPTIDELQPGETKETVFRTDAPEPEGKVISFPGQKNRSKAGK